MKFRKPGLRKETIHFGRERPRERQRIILETHEKPEAAEKREGLVTNHSNIPFCQVFQVIAGQSSELV